MLKPVLIITCRAGNESWCAEEIGNTLFMYDPLIYVEKTRYPGVLIVYSRLEPDKAYKYALTREYGFVQKIIPVHKICSIDEDISKEIIELINRVEKIRLRIRIRGRRGYSSILWRKIIKVLGSKNVKHDPSSEICLYVEGINDTLYIGKGKC